MSGTSQIMDFEVVDDVFNLFLSVNFAGYTQSEQEYKNGNHTIDLSKEDVLKALEIDFVRPHPCLKRPDLLLYLKNTLFEKSRLADSPEDALFTLKFLHIYQLCMETFCPSLQSKIQDLNLRIATSYCSSHLKELEVSEHDFLDLFRSVKPLDDDEDEENSENTKLTDSPCLSRKSFFEWLLLNFHISSNSVLFSIAAKFLELASKFVGFGFDFDGQLGKRTRFQQKSLPQLVLKTTKVDHSKAAFSSFSPVEHPKSIANKDDTLLQNVSLDDQIHVEDLSPDQIAVLLAAALLEQKTDPIEELKFEQIDALCTKVLSQQVGFMTSIALFQLRSESERRNTRRVERAVQQMESIVDVLENRENKILDPLEMRRRVADIWISSPMKPIWGVKKFYAKVLESLALTSEAITVYESIFAWRNVVEGYQAMNMKEKALKILEALREDHPDDPYYLCLIAEIRRDESLLKKVLELTHDKYPNAHKALGMMALENKDYKKSFIHYKRVFELVPLSVRSVYNYGVSAWEIGEMRDAIIAFHHVTCIDPDHFKAWNNLAAAYLATNQKSKAAKILRQGLQVDRDNYNMWCNLYEIGAELPSKKDCFFAVQQMMTFKKASSEFNPKPLLKVILAHTKAAEHTYYPSPPLEQPLDPYEEKQLLLSLDMAHETCTFDPMTLRLMANLRRPEEKEESLEVIQKYIELLDLAEKREMQAGRKDPDYLNTINSLLDSYEARLRYSEILGKSPAAAKKLVFFRLRPLISAVERLFKEKPSAEQESPQLAEILVKAKGLLEELKG